MPPSLDHSPAGLTPRAARPGLLARLSGLGKKLGAWLTELEYRLRVSSPFTFGRGGQRVFYPGCSLTAADLDLVMRAYEWLRERDPGVLLWSDCCGMPLEKFSSPEAAGELSGEAGDVTRRRVPLTKGCR